MSFPPRHYKSDDSGYSRREDNHYSRNDNNRRMTGHYNNGNNNRFYASHHPINLNSRCGNSYHGNVNFYDDDHYNNNNNNNHPRRHFSQQDAEDMWQRDGVARGVGECNRNMEDHGDNGEDNDDRKMSGGGEDGDDDVGVQPMKCASLPPAAARSSSSVAAAAAGRENNASSPNDHLDEIPKLLQLDLFEGMDGNGDGVASVLSRLHSLMKKEIYPKDWKAHRDDIVNLGGHGMILVAMRKFPTHEQVQLYGLQCISKIAWNHPDKVSRAISKSGGFDLVVRALNTSFSSAEELHCAACCALRNLLWNLSDQPNTKVRKEDMGNVKRFIFGQNNNGTSGISLVLEMMKRYPDNAEIQRICCGIWNRIGGLGGAGARDAMKQANVTNVVISAIDRFPDDESLQASAAKFMVQFFGGKEGEGWKKSSPKSPAKKLSKMKKKGPPPKKKAPPSKKKFSPKKFHGRYC